MMPQEQPLKDILAPALRVLKSLGGQLVFADDDGDQFVLASKEAFENLTAKAETQLPLPDTASEPQIESEPQEDVPIADTLEQANRELALSHVDEETIDDLDIEADYPSPPPVRVRFEPIKGDLPPDLQE